MLAFDSLRDHRATDHNLPHHVVGRIVRALTSLPWALAILFGVVLSDYLGSISVTLDLTEKLATGVVVLIVSTAALLTAVYVMDQREGRALLGVRMKLETRFAGKSATETAGKPVSLSDCMTFLEQRMDASTRGFQILVSILALIPVSSLGPFWQLLFNLGYLLAFSGIVFGLMALLAVWIEREIVAAHEVRLIIELIMSGVLVTPRDVALAYLAIQGPARTEISHPGEVG